jgi:hypothetical protein
MGSRVSPRYGLDDVCSRGELTLAVRPVTPSIPTVLFRHVQLYHAFLIDAGFDLNLGRVTVNWGAEQRQIPSMTLSTSIIKVL